MGAKKVAQEQNELKLIGLSHVQYVKDNKIKFKNLTGLKIYIPIFWHSPNF